MSQPDEQSNNPPEEVEKPDAKSAPQEPDIVVVENFDEDSTQK